MKQLHRIITCSWELSVKLTLWLLTCVEFLLHEALALGHGHNVNTTWISLTHKHTVKHWGQFTPLHIHSVCLLISHIMINTIILVTDSIIIQCLDYTYSNVYRSLDAAFISISSRSIAWSVRAIHWLEKEREWVTEQVSEYVREWASEWVSVSEWVREGEKVSEWVSVRVSEWVSMWVSECVSEWVGKLVGEWVLSHSRAPW